MKKSSILIALLGIVIGLLLAVLIQQIGLRRSAMRVSGADWRKVSLILQSIDENYVDSVDRAKVSDAVAAAALSALDPHSSYMPPQILEETEADLTGNFDGIGIQFNVPNDTAVVIEVIPGGPSEKIGLQPGDRLLKVDSTVIAGVRFPQDSMVRRIKGVAGSKVLVTVQRGREVIPFEITRGKIPTYSVDAAFMVNDTTGYLRLSKFSRTTADEFVKSALELSGEGMKELVVDLRDNSGGYLDQACKLANLFLPRKAMIVYLEGRNRKREEYRADGRGPFQDIGLKVLVDEGSASASEILAGALQDNGRATLYGRRTFGKGLVQEPFFFTDGSGMRITVARYYTPTGRCIQKPYSGNKEEYLLESYDRYENGELFHPDSIHFADSLKFTTPKGKTVYGGGGIMPDIYVPLVDDSTEYYFNRIVNLGLLYQYAFDYTDRHRQQLKQYQTVSAFDQRFVVTDAMFDEMVRLADERGIVGTEVQRQVARREANTLLKAYIARNLFDDEGFYPIYAPMDEILQRAIEELQTSVR